jgi:hypothetical protein
MPREWKWNNEDTKAGGRLVGKYSRRNFFNVKKEYIPKSGAA